MSPENEELFERFVESRGLSDHSITMYRSALMDLDAFIQGTSFREVTEERMRQYWRRRRDRWKASSQATKIILFKTFFRVLLGYRKYTYPDVVAWMQRPSQRRIRKKVQRPNQLLTEEDVQRLVDASFTVRDRALYMMLWDSGARIGEILDLRVGSIKFDEHGAYTYVSGKTGQRRIRFVHASAYIRELLSVHPQHDDPNSFLFLTSRGNTLTESRVWAQLKTVAKRAHLEKNVYPHLFRHSRATINAGFLTEAQMNQAMGWTQGSQMPSTYIQLSGVDLDPAILEHYGKTEIPDTKKEELLRPIQCPRCEQENPATNDICFQCGSYLNVKTAQEKELEDTERFSKIETENQELKSIVKELQTQMQAIQEERKETDSLMDKMIQDPEFLAMFRKKLRELS
ncbi:MAG: tyrosine-type recombinase/integrase [Candidatus Bathyarchaeota archaeon]|nr:tyrosine-type recombinase/integrase [Candidatus Bathyarchaeota archaeon]